MLICRSTERAAYFARASPNPGKAAMKLARPATAVIVGWTVVLLLIAAFVSVLLNDRWQNAQALPLMFWTLFSGVVLVAIACAIGLPNEKAAFWRTWVLTLAACLFEGYSNAIYGIFGEIPLPDTVDSWRSDRLVEDQWVYDALATVAGTVAALLRWWQTPTITRVFCFRIVHLFSLSTVVALSCWAVNSSAEPWIGNYCELAVLFVSVVAAVLLGAGWGHGVFLIGFLAGSFASKILIDRWELWQEWEALSEVAISPQLYFILMPLLSLYAGLFTGVFAAMLYRPPPQPAIQDSQCADA